MEDERRSFWRLLRRFGYHFRSLFVIVVLMAVDQSPFKAVVYATAAGSSRSSFLDPAHRVGPMTAARPSPRARWGCCPSRHVRRRGMIVAVVTLTGLGLKRASIIVGASAAILVVHRADRALWRCSCSASPYR